MRCYFQGMPNKKTMMPNRSTWVFLNNKNSLKKAVFYYTNNKNHFIVLRYAKKR
ncbi:hypothetical protein RV18_GL003345 [Enterococcus termitis]|nr:hypothetical protein RV18_GL003345 [Enterococcus termitis]